MGNKNSGLPTPADRFELARWKGRLGAVAGALATCAVGLWAPQSPAQDAPERQAGALEEIVITGSRIKRENLELGSPVTPVQAEEFHYQGTSAVESVLNRMPQFTADSNENGSNGSDGTARVNLRNLGPSRVLVLVDGQRMLPTEMGDVNFIPSALIQRVDVVTGGASAVYGSDAVAGVVNFILDKNLDGVRVSAQYGSAWHENDQSYPRALVRNANYELADGNVWDGGRYDFNIAMGMNSADGKGNVTFYLGYRKLDPVTQDSRDYSACGLNLTGDNDALVCGGSSNNQWGKFSIRGGPNRGRAFNNTKDGQPVWVDITADESPYLYNYAPTNYIQRDDKRITAGAFAHYEYNEHAEIYGSLMFMDDHTFSQAAPSAYFQGNEYQINCDNPLMSTQQAAILCGSAAGTSTNVPVFIGYRFAGAGGARRDDLRHTDYRLNLGSKGAVVDGWTYDASFLFSTAVLDESYKNDLDLIKGARALQAVNVDGVPTCRSVVDGSDPSCVPANVFTAFGISDEAYGYILSPTFTHGVQEQRVMSLALNGDLDQYGLRSPWADSGLAIATGAEYRTEELTFEADALAQLKGTKENAGDYAVREAFVELEVPLVAAKPFVDSLSVNMGYRYSDYSIAGGTGFSADTYKFELRYAPVQSVRLRSSYNRAVRAPNITELFAAQVPGNVSAQDPCALRPGDAGFEALREKCMRSGVTEAQYGFIDECPADTCVTLGGGNLNLRPEIADTYTYGVVFTPSFLDNFTFTADYFDIYVDGYIGSVDAQTVINQCIQKDAEYFCNLFHRDPGSGVLFGTNGYIVATNQNTGFLQTSGMDFTSTYGFDLASVLPGDPDAGSLNLSFVGTWLNSRRIEQLPGLGSYNCVGLFGPTCGQPSPDWRHNLRATWTSPQGKATVSANWRYFGEVDITSNQTNEFLQGDPENPIKVNGRISAYSYLDLAGTYELVESVEVRWGINNVFDRNPPVIAAGLLSSFGNGNTYPGVYDPMGRLLYLGMTVEF